MIFLTTAVLAFLINWSLVHQNIGSVTLGGTGNELVMATVDLVLGLECAGR